MLATIGSDVLWIGCSTPTALHCSPRSWWRSASALASTSMSFTTTVPRLASTESGREIRGRTAPAITYGHSKIHRPDLKQLLLILTMAADGNVPVAFRCTDGNASDARTHIETWNALRTVAGCADFLCVADSKL